MSAKRAIFLLSFLLTACGTHVPNIQEFPGTSADAQQLVEAIVQSIHCELKNAITDVIDKDHQFGVANHGIRYTDWLLNDWGVQLALTLTIEEKSSISPNAVGLPPSPATAIFTIAGGATLSADATRIDKLNFYYTVAELYDKTHPHCVPGTEPPRPGSLLIQSDLGLKEWLFSQVMLYGTDEVGVYTSPKGVFKQNVLSHEVKFEVVSSGNITPAWKLVRATVNQSGSFFSASRDRTHDLLMTFGPIDRTLPNSLTASAEAAHLASQIGLAVATDTNGHQAP